MDVAMSKKKKTTTNKTRDSNFFEIDNINNFNLKGKKEFTKKPILQLCAFYMQIMLSLCYQVYDQHHYI